MPPGGHLRPLGGGFLITVAAHKCGLHLQQHGGVHQQQTLPQRTNADCISLRRGTFGDDLSFASAHKCGLHPFCAGSIFARKELCLSAQMRIASARRISLTLFLALCLSAQMRIASCSPREQLFFFLLCLSAQMRIASYSRDWANRMIIPLPQRTNADCILPCWFASSIGITLPQRTNADCINKRVNRIRVRNTLPQRTNADCIYQAQKKAENGQLCLSAQMRIASIIKVSKLFTCPLCLSAQMRIASTMNGIRSPALKLCLSAQMRIASPRF